MLRLPAWVLILLTVFVATSVHAQANPVSQVQLSGTELSGAELSVSVSALDGAGNPVVGLAPEAFAATLAGRAMPAVSVDANFDTGLPLGLVVVVDTSGSMAGGPLDAAKGAISTLFSSLAPRDRAALIGFASQVTTIVPFTSDGRELEASLAALQPSGNTALYGAVAEAARVASEATEPRRAVVLLSDGKDFGNVSTFSRDDSLAAATSSGVPFFVVGLGTEIDQEYLSAVAREPANLLGAASAGELAALYRRISERLRAQYTVRLQVPGGLAPGKHELAITVSGVTAKGTVEIPDGGRAAPVPRLSGMPAELNDVTTIEVKDLPAGARIAVFVDGEPVEASGTSFRLAPRDYAPGVHFLRVEFSPAAAGTTVEQEFRVAVLAPELLAPGEGADLAPGDLIRLEVRAQPGGVSARLLVDGEEADSADSEPYELLIPSKLTPGDHELTIALEASGVHVERNFKLTASGRGGSPFVAYAVIVACAVAAIVAAAFGLHLVAGRLRERVPAFVDVDRLANWAGKRRDASNAQDGFAAPAPDRAPKQPWGELVVTAGPDTGRRFKLLDDVELVGSGKGATVRLRDKSVAKAHFVVDRDRRLVPSTPTAEVTVDGNPTRRADLAHGATIVAGGTTFRFQATGDAVAPDL